MIKTSKKFVILIEIYYIFFENKKLLFSLNNKNYKIFNSINNELQKINKKRINNIDSLYIIGSFNFGNYIICLNNAIILCEFFHCKRIIIQSNKNIFINNKIFYQKYNLTIESNYKFIPNNNSLELDLYFLFFQLNFSSLGNVNRFHIFREEILNNLPKIKVHPNDLYIYIRGGDIFKVLNVEFKTYPQPPLCFYENLLNKYKFREIRIISEDKLNPILILLEKHYNIKYIRNNIKIDISYLANSYNIVLAKSSFVVSIIKLNYNLKFVWEYDFYKFSERFYHLHHSVYTFPFKYTIYKLKASESYKTLMFPFKNSEKQRKLMIEEKCDDNFYIIPPRIS
jgi:hypothetical protein